MNDFRIIDDKGRTVAKQIIYKKELLEALGIDTNNAKVPEDEQELYKYHVIEQLESLGVKIILFNEYQLMDLGKVKYYTVMRYKHGGDNFNFIFTNEQQINQLINALRRALYYRQKAIKINWELYDLQKRIELFSSLPGETMRSINEKTLSAKSRFRNKDR